MLKILIGIKQNFHVKCKTLYILCGEKSLSLISKDLCQSPFNCHHLITVLIMCRYAVYVKKNMYRLVNKNIFKLVIYKRYSQHTFKFVIYTCFISYQILIIYFFNKFCYNNSSYYQIFLIQIKSYKHLLERKTMKMFNSI